jgi:hypothetical protein
MHDGHGAAGAARPELFAKDAVLARLHRGVVQAGCIERHLVPAMYGVNWTARSRRFGDIAALKARSVRLVKVSGLRLREQWNAQADEKEACGGEFHRRERRRDWLFCAEKAIREIAAAD